MNRLLIMGAGGHGKVVADMATQSGLWDEIAFLDDRYPQITQLHEWPILGKMTNAANFIPKYNQAVVGIGNNAQRMLKMNALKKLGYSFPLISHGSAAISPKAQIGEGVVIFPRAVINADTCINAGVIINSAAVVEHDCFLAEGVHISPRATLAGGVRVGKYSWIGIGATVIEYKCIGENVLVAAGAVVIDDLPDNVVVAGVPAKKIK